MNVDDIFKLPPLPKGSAKRKLEVPQAPSLSDEPISNKSSRLDSNGSASSAKGKGRASVDEEEDDEELENGRDFAPNGDADYFAEEDSDGRFFGGGLNSVQKQILNLMEDGEADEAGELTAQSVRKQLLALEKAINKNRDMRTKYGNDPSKFVDSEFALLEALNSLLLLASSPTLAFPLLLELSTPTSLADLLSHENTEVVIAVIEVLEEWTDEEVLDGPEIDEEETAVDEAGKDERKDAMRDLVEGMIEAGVVELVVSGLERLNEEDEQERGGVYHTLGLLENLLIISPAGALPLLSPKSALLKFLLERIAKGKIPAGEQNRYYAAEILAILLSTSVDGIAEGRKRIASESAVDGLLKLVSVYRRRDPSSADEIEFMENIFDALCSALSESEVKQAFLEGEGVELCVIMMKEKKLSRTRAIKTLDHALGGRAGIPLCEKFVEMLGLKTLFSAFMGAKALKKTKATLATHEDSEHLLSLISSLLTSLASDSPSRLRLLTKFVEGDYEKVDRLVELREEVEARVDTAAAELIESGEEIDEDELYLEKLAQGLFSLQLCDYIIAWLAMEDDGVRDHTKMLLARRDKSLSDVIIVLKEYRKNIGDEEEEVDPEIEVEFTEVEEQKAILGNLIEYLESLDI